MTNYLSLGEAAEHFRVSVRTLQNWRKLGFPIIKIRGRVLVPLAEAEAWVNKHIAVEKKGA